jgi:hypothetical protein
MAETLRVDGRTVRRWFSGATHVPGPTEVALELLLPVKTGGVGQAQGQISGTRTDQEAGSKEKR